MTTSSHLSSPLYPVGQRDLVSLLHKECHLQLGYEKHDHFIKLGLDQNVFIENMILNMYGRCGDLYASEAMFQMAPKKESCAFWNSMISIYTKHGHCEEAFELYMQMQRENVMPTKATFKSVSHACDNPSFFEERMRLHECIVEFGYEVDIELGISLVRMYGRCGSVELSCIMFEKLCEQNVVSWTTMITIYANHGYSNDALKAFEKMQEEGIAPNSVTFLGILSGVFCVTLGHMIHSLIMKYGFDSDNNGTGTGTGTGTDLRLGTSLVNMYGKCGNLADALSVFDHLPTKSVITWNAMIDAYAQNNKGTDALWLFRRMRSDGVNPDTSTFVSLLVACLSSDRIEMEGESIHACIKGTKHEGNIMVATSLMNMYCKCGAMEKAQFVFDHMHRRNVVTWNTFICGYVHHREDGYKVLEHVHRMLEEGIMPDNITYMSIFGACKDILDIVEARRFHSGLINNHVDLEADAAVGTALVNVYGKCGHLSQAHFQFDMILKHNPVAWNAIISAYAQQGNLEESSRLFKIMLQEYPLFDEALLITALGVCADLPCYTQGNLVHSLVVKLGFDGFMDVGTTLINMYGKCSKLEEAKSCFFGLNVHGVPKWNALIGAYIRNGCYSEAIELFHKMEEDSIWVDRITFVTILGASLGSLALSEGISMAFHDSMVSHGFESSVDTGTALVNMYGRSGNLKRAYLIFVKLPARGLVSWNSIMTSFAQHGLGQEVFHLFIQMLAEGLKPDAITSLVVLLACSHAGLINMGQGFFKSMLSHYNIEPKPEHFGCMVDLHGRVGMVEEAESLIYRLGVEDHAFVWRILLGACKLHDNIDIGKHVMQNAAKLDSRNSSTYVLISNMHLWNGFNLH